MMLRIGQTVHVIFGLDIERAGEVVGEYPELHGLLVEIRLDGEEETKLFSPSILIPEGICETNLIGRDSN